MEEKKIRISDIAMLDLRNAKEDVIRRIDSISDVAMILTSEANSQLLANIRMTDVACVVTLPDSANLRMTNGSESFNAHSFDSDEPLYIMVNGTLKFTPDVTADMIENKIKFLIVNGSLTCPYSVLGALTHVGAQINGSTHSYPDGAVLLNNNVVLDMAFVAGTESAVYCVKKLNVFDADAARAAVEKGIVFYPDKLVSYESTRPYALKLLHSSSHCKQVFIKDGYKYADGNTHWDKYNLRKLSGAFYIDGNLKIDKAATAALFDGITAIDVSGKLTIPEELMDALLDEHADLELNYDELNISGLDDLEFNRDMAFSVEALNALTGTHKLNVNGDVKFAIDVTPELVLDKISALNINGDCTCPPSLSLLLPSLGTINGDIIVRLVDEEPEPEKQPEPDDSKDYIVIKDMANYKM